MADVPPEAVTEATDELTKWMLYWGWITGLTEDQVRQVCRDAADRVLEVGAPHIRAQTYAEIRQLATKHGATYPHSLIASGPLAGQGRTAPFADLIGGGETDG